MKPSHIQLLGKYNYDRLIMFSKSRRGWERGAQTLNATSLFRFCEFLDTVIEEKKTLPKDMSLFMQQDGFLSASWEINDQKEIAEVMWEDTLFHIWEEGMEDGIDIEYQSPEYTPELQKLIQKLLFPKTAFLRQKPSI